MSNEFIVKNGLIVGGNVVTSGTITINGALAATQSWVTSQAYLTSASLSGYATQSYVTSALAALVDAAPAALDTLNELAAALGDDASFSTTITNSIANKVAKSGDTMTGSLLFANVADNVRLQKGSSFLNLRDPWNNIHLYNAGDGNYIDSNIHYWRSQSASYWMTLNNGNLGIGTVSPVSRLDVDGIISSRGIFIAQNSGTYNVIYNASNSVSMYLGGSGDPANYYDNTTHNFRSSGGGTTYAVITNGGNVGIGTTAPAQKLDVLGTIRSQVTSPGAGNGDVYAFAIHEYNGNNGRLGLGLHDTGDAFLGLYSDGGVTTRIDSNGSSYFMGGNVGIGTTSPNEKLDVRGNIYIPQNNYIYFDNSGHYIRRGASDVEIQGYNGIQLRTNSTTRVYIDQTGNVGIGTTSPSAKLHINAATGDGLKIITADVATIKMGSTTGGTSYWGFATTNLAASDFGIYQSNAVGGDPITAGTPRLYFKSDGNIGIGTTSPTEKLHVNGDTRIVGNTYVGGIINAYQGDASIWVPNLGQAFTVKQTTGNVGIGTTSPNDKLSVNGNIGVEYAGYFGFYRYPGAGHTFSTDGITSAMFGIAAGVFSGRSDAGLTVSGYDQLRFYTENSERIRINRAGKVSIGTTDTNSDKSDFTVYTGSGASIALVDDQVRMGGADVNWGVALRSYGALQTYGQVLYLTTQAGNYSVTVQPNGVTSAQFYQSETYINTYTKINYNWGGGDHGAEAFTIQGTYPSITLRSTNADFKWLLHTDASGNFRWYTGSTYNNNAWTNRFTFGIDNNFYVDYGHVYVSGGNSTQWNTAYSWGNHASAGYLTSETDTLASVTSRGNSTTNRINVRGIGNQSGGNIMMGDVGQGTNKWSYLTGTHYNASSQPQGFALIGGLSTDSFNAVVIGGNIYETNPATEIQFWTHSATTHNLGGTQRGVINSAGNWGIGTTSPYSLLQVGNPEQTTPAELTIASRYDGGGPILNFRTDHPDNNNQWNMARIVATDDGNYNGRIEFRTTDSSGYTGVQPTTKMLIKASGNVGIGIGSPSEKLHVSGAAIFDGGAGNSSTDSVVYITKSTNDDWGLYVNNAGLDYGMYTRTSPSANYAFAIHNGTTWTTRITGNAIIYLGEKDAIRGNSDSWLRLNNSNDYTSGVYTPGIMRADGGFNVSGNTVWHAANDGSGSGLDADLLDGQDSSVFLRLLPGGAEASLDSYTDNGVRSVSFAGHSQHLLSWNAGGSTGTVQQLFHYGTPNNGWRIRNKTDNSSWSDWGYVVMASSNQGLISGTIATQSWVGSQSYATTSYVTTQINNLINGAPGALDTLSELASALGNDASFATTVTNSIAGKVSKSGDTMTSSAQQVLNVYHGAATGDFNDALFLKSIASGQQVQIGMATLDADGDHHRVSLRAYKGTQTLEGVFGIALRQPSAAHIQRFTLDYLGNVTIGGFLTESSSLKLKENVETSEGNLEKVVNLRPVTYNKIGSQTTELGLIAEEVAEVYPEFVQYDENGEPVGVNYSRLTAALIGAVKELNEQLQELKRNK